MLNNSCLELITKKISNYTHVLNGYKRFINKKDILWFEPPKNIWWYKELGIRINPELGIRIGSSHYLVKLYFKDSPLKASECGCIIRLLEKSLSTGIYSGYKGAILDVRKGKLHSTKNSHWKEVDYWLEGEAENLLHIWRNLNIA